MRAIVLVLSLALLAGFGAGFAMLALRGDAGRKPAGRGPATAVQDDGRVRITIDVREPAPGRAQATSASVYFARDYAGAQDRQRMAWTSLRDQIRVPPGLYWVWAERDAPPVGISAKQRVAVGAASPVIVLALEARPGIRGRIRFPEPVIAPDVHVWALRFDGTAPPALDAMLGDRDVVRGTVDATVSRYSFRDLEPGRYLVAFFLGGRSLGTKAVVDVGDGVVDRDLVVPAFAPSRYLVVHVLDGDGRALPGVTFLQNYRDDATTIGRSAVAMERADGAWYVPRDMGVDARSAAQMTPQGRFTLTVRTPEHGSVDRPYALDEEGDVVIRMRDPARLSLRIEGFVESGLGRNASVHLAERRGPDGLTLQGRGARVKSDGHVTLPILQPGERQAVLVVPSALGSIHVHLFSLHIESGTHEISVPMPPLHDLRVAGGEPSDREFLLTRLDGAGTYRHQAARPTEDGLTVFQFVPPGRYRVETISGGASRAVEVEVPTEQAIRLP